MEGLLGAVDVEVVGIGRGDDSMGRVQGEEAAVEFVGFHHGPRRGAFLSGGLGEQEVGAGGAGDAAEEGFDGGAVLMQQVGEQRRGGGLAVRARHGEEGAVRCQFAEEFGALEDREPGVAQQGEQREVVGHGRGADDGPPVRAACIEVGEEAGGQGGAIAGGVHRNAFFDEGAGQGGFRSVMAGDGGAVVAVPPGESAHADAADAEEEQPLVLHQPRVSRERTERTSSTTRSAASGRAVRAMAVDRARQASGSSRRLRTS